MKNDPFALLLESAEHLNDPLIRVHLQEAGEADHQWVRSECSIHTTLCPMGQRNTDAEREVFTQSIAAHWEGRCSQCPNPLAGHLTPEEGYLISKAVILLKASRIDTATAGFVQARTLQEALGGLVRIRRAAFCNELLTRVHKKSDTVRENLLENVGTVLGEHAAAQVAAPRSGGRLVEVPEGITNANQFYRRAAGHWRREKSGEILSALESYRSSNDWRAERDSYGVELYALLQERYEVILANTTLQLVAIPSAALQYMNVPLLAEAVQKAGRYLQGHYFLETLPVVAKYLQNFQGYYTPLVDFGEITQEDSDAIRETALTLYSDSLQDGEPSEPAEFMEVARLLN